MPKRRRGPRAKPLDALKGKPELQNPADKLAAKGAFNRIKGAYTHRQLQKKPGAEGKVHVTAYSYDPIPIRHEGGRVTAWKAQYHVTGDRPGTVHSGPEKLTKNGATRGAEASMRELLKKRYGSKVARASLDRLVNEGMDVEV